jgi:hypothetical protein
MAMELRMVCPAEKPAEPTVDQLWAEAPNGVINNAVLRIRNEMMWDKCFMLLV